MPKTKTLAYLGPKGTHSEEVALHLNEERRARGASFTLVPFAGIYDALAAVEEGEIDCCAAPVENSIEGSINITLDTLAHNVNLQIEREIVWAVHNHLLVKDPGETVTTILSHSQPLAQCRQYVKAHYKNAEIKQVSSSSKAAKIVASGEKGLAAIGTKRAGKLYGLTSIASDIEDNLTNCTRFLILTKPTSRLVLGTDKTSLICQINGEKSGSLCDVLTEFSKRDVNLTRIESRPARTGLGEYIFFLDLDAPCDKPNVKAAIDALTQKSLWIKNLGSFSVVYRDAKKS